MSSRHANALPCKVELFDAVLTKRDERNATEVNHGSVVEHSRGQIVGSIARDAVPADAVSA